TRRHRFGRGSETRQHRHRNGETASGRAVTGRFFKRDGVAEIWGAHAPSPAHFGASPKSLSSSTKESRWRGANDSTRGRVRSPEKSSRGAIMPRYRRGNAPMPAFRFRRRASLYFYLRSGYLPTRFIRDRKLRDYAV